MMSSKTGIPWPTGADPRFAAGAGLEATGAAKPGPASVRNGFPARGGSRAATRHDGNQIKSRQQ